MQRGLGHPVHQAGTAELAARIKDLAARLKRQDTELAQARAESARLTSERDAALDEIAGLIDLVQGAGDAVTVASTATVVIGEYTGTDGTTIEVSKHPGVEDDDAHQVNWLRKAAQCVSALRTGIVYADRDWISSLGYAHSTAAADGGALLRRRCAWAAEGLRDHKLLLPGVYVIFDLDSQASLRRRSGRLRPGHPWSEPRPLELLREFYASPASVLGPIHPGLAAAIASVARLTLSGHDDPQASLRQLTRAAPAS